MISFLFLFTWWQFCIVQILSGTNTFLHISSVFFQSLIGNFLSFLLSPTLWLGIFFLCFLPMFDRELSPFALFSCEGKVYGELGPWLKACRIGWTWYTLERWFGQRLRDKGDVPHYFHDTHETMMIRKFYVKLVMHAPMWTLRHQVFMAMWH